ncbi:MAG: peptide deformylase [Deltaproteobacteria bacterium]|nr:peptide deformylase [Deltaproteobacteria bacterium]
MAILEIIKYPDERLKTKSSVVETIDAATHSFIGDLVDTMRASPGVGLAASQIGRLIRVIAVDVTPKNPGHGLIVLINPEITGSSGAKVGREGCLSVPEYTANITRATNITVRGVGKDGRETVIESEGFEAVALQHEIDHLDGILFIDRIASMKRDLFKRKIKDM